MKTFAVVGQDARVQAAGTALGRMGFEVLGAEEVFRADCILLPMPLQGDRAGLVQLLRAAKPGALAFAGRVGPEALAAARDAGVVLLDYFDREDLALLNAVPTAEGCLHLLMEHRTRTLWGSPVLVLGYGRIGQAVGRRLLALGALPAVAARRPAQRALAETDGCRALDLTELSCILPGVDAVVNTIPAAVLGAAQLTQLPARSLVIDLASAPGGTDFAAAKALGHTALHALSLPAKCAPVTAGELVARTVAAMLREREGCS